MSTNKVGHDFNYFASRSIDLLMIFAPSIGFIAQILKFREKKSSEGFSKLICLILLIANIFRSFWWIGDHFNIVLLFQSFFSIITQIVVIRECLKYINLDTSGKKPKGGIYSNDNLPNPYLYKPISIFDFNSFWNWPYLIDYLYFLSLFCLILGFISQIIGYENKIYVQLLGISAASVEATIGVPQILNNCRSKNTSNLSIFMIFSWILGDSVKTIYNLTTENIPLQMIVCGILQLISDIIILLQIFYYSFNTNNKKLKEDYTNNERKLRISTCKDENDIINLSTKEGDSNFDELQYINSV